MKNLYINSHDPNTIMHEISLFFQNNDDDFVNVATNLRTDWVVGRNQKFKSLFFDAKIPD